MVTTANEVKADDLDNYDLTGYKKSPVGYIENTNKDLMAKDSQLQFTIPNNGNMPKTINVYEPNGFRVFGLRGSGTLNKEDIKAGNKILLGTFIEVYKKGQPYFPEINPGYGTHNLQLYFKNDELGRIDIEENSDATSHLYKVYLRVATTKNYASDPTYTFYIDALGEIGSYSIHSSQTMRDKLFIGDTTNHKFIVGNNNIYDLNMIYKEGSVLHDSNDLGHKPLETNWYAGDYYNQIVMWKYLPGDNGKYTFNEIKKNKINPQKEIFCHVFKIQSSISKLPSNFTFTGRRFFYPVDKNGNIIDSFVFDDNFDANLHSSQEKNDNLSAADLLNQTNIDQITFSKQNDGSVLVAFKYDTSHLRFTNDLLEGSLNNNYLYNLSTTSDREDIKHQTLQAYKNNNMMPLYTQMMLNFMDAPDHNYYIETDVTPGLTPITKVSSSMGNDSSFNAELYKTTLVHYLDSSNKDSQVSNDSIMGIQNQVSNYQLNIPKGYILDTKSGKNKDGTQYKWSADKKSIAYTFNEDQKINDANPINIYITHGTHNTNDNSGKSTRTIQYTGLPDNLKPKDNVQTVLFKRSGVTDDVSGETTYGDWQPQSGNGHYTAVTSPTFAGYKPDQAVVPDTAATPNKNETVTVNYSRTNQNAKLTVHDDTANTDLNDYAENSTGLYQDQINFKTAPSAVEQELKDKGYNIVSDSFKGSPTYNADDSKNNFVIHVTHKIVPVTPDHPKTPTDVIPDTKQHYPTGVDTNDLNKDVQRSIFYKYEDNSQAEPTVVQKAHFDRTVKVDAVTQKIVDNGTWATKDNYPEVTTKSIDGYTPDKTKVDSATPSMTTNQDQTVVYHANDEDAAITYIDDTTGKVLKTDAQKAKYKQTIKFATDPNTQIQTYKDQGYVLVSSDWKDGSTYQTDPARNKFTVHLKHGTSTVTPDKPKKPTDIIPGTNRHYPTGVDTNDLNQSQQRQITYTYADSKKQASPTVTQKATFHRTATVDNVTGKTTYTDWTTSDQYPEVKSPTIEGYTPDKSNVSVTKPVLNTKQDVAVVYNPNPEQVDVIAQDNTGKQLSKSTLHGNFNTDYTATTPVIKGYHLIKMPTNTHGTYKTHNDPIIYIYAPDSNSVPEQTDGTPRPDKSSYPDDITPAKRSPKLPETGSTTLVSELKSDFIKLTHLF